MPSAHDFVAFASEKDSILDRIANIANVAQFVSFAPGPAPSVRHSRLRGYVHDYRFADAPHAVSALLALSPEGRVNIRSFRLELSKGGDFVYGLTSVNEVLARLNLLASSGWFTIVNETIDVNDGGVSGVALGSTIEFAPGDTPRCVDKPGSCRLPLSIADEILRTVYGFSPEIAAFSGQRTEFSIHPLRRGHRHDHTVVWEIEETVASLAKPKPAWPNRFSEFLGDKVFGLLVANSVGCRVPATTVIPRNVAPFSFGTRTGTNELWLRTAPRIQSPGHFPTSLGWRDPFKLVDSCESENGLEMLASIISQESCRRRVFRCRRMYV